MHIFLNGMGASAGAGLTYLYNVVPQFSRAPAVKTTLAVSSDLRTRFEGCENVVLADVPPLRSTLARFFFEQLRLPTLIRDADAHVLVSAGNFAIRHSPVPQILLSGNSLYVSEDFERDLRARREYGMWLDTRIRGFFARKSVHWAESTIAPTNAFAGQLQSWTGKPVETVYHGFDYRAFVRDDSLLPDAIARKLASERDSLRLLFVSHYNYYRNLETLFRAIPLICGRLAGRKVRLFLTCTLRDEETPGGYKTAVASALIAQLGIRNEVIELGAIPYQLLHHLYRACDIYVTPAYTETFAHPLVEAMASGLPIVASDMPVHREVARDAALYFERFSPEKLAEAVYLLAVHDELRTRLSIHGKERSLDFSWNRHVNQLLGVAERLAFPSQPRCQRMSA